MKYAAAWVLVVAAGAVGQVVEVHGVRSNGDLVRFDLGTGTAYTIANTGVIPAHGCNAWWGDGGQSGTPKGAILLSGTGQNADQTYCVPFTLIAVSNQSTVMGVPAGYTMAWGGGHVLLISQEPSQPELLAQFQGGVLSVIGSTGRTDLSAFVARSPGELFAIGSDGGGALYSIHPTTGAAMLIGGQGTFGPDTRALTAMPDGTLMAAGEGLRSVDAATGVAMLIGPSGFTDIVALSSATDTCYANCDGGGHPVLNVQDFGCFLAHFAFGSYYANCDRSTTPPTLNVADFSCFLQKFISGCP